MTPFDVTDSDNCVEHRDFKRGRVHGQTLVQALFTDKQYDAVARLYATLLGRFPNLRLAYPIEETHAETRAPGEDWKAFGRARNARDAQSDGAARDDLPNVDTDKSRTRGGGFTGALGHFHVQRNKFDPGPAFDWKPHRRDAPRWRRGRRRVREDRRTETEREGAGRKTSAVLGLSRLSS